MFEIGRSQYKLEKVDIFLKMIDCSWLKFVNIRISLYELEDIDKKL